METSSRIKPDTKQSLRVKEKYLLILEVFNQIL